MKDHDDETLDPLLCFLGALVREDDAVAGDGASNLADLRPTSRELNQLVEHVLDSWAAGRDSDTPVPRKRTPSSPSAASTSPRMSSNSVALPPCAAVAPANEGPRPTKKS